MYTRAIRNDISKIYRVKKSLMAKVIRWQYGAEQARPWNNVKNVQAVADQVRIRTKTQLFSNVLF